MKKSLLTWLATVALVLVSGFVPTSRVNAAPSWLEQCVTNVNDPLFDKAFILSLVGYASEADFETSVTNGTWTVQLATGSGAFGYHRGNNPDLYCGNGQNNSRDYLDSHNNSRDFFIGGAGNDSMTGTMWQSTFYGGEGDDSANRVEEASYFYGGPGTDSCTFVSTGSPWGSFCLTDGGPAPAVPGTPPAPTAVAGVSSAVVTVAAGSGGTLTSYAVTSTPGSFTCTVTGSSGNCTVSGLTNGTSYTFKATATNGGGTSGSSISSNAVTSVAPTTTTVAPVLSIVIEAPVTTIATGQNSVATIAPTTSTIAVRGTPAATAPTTTIAGTRTVISTTTTVPAIVTTTTVGPPSAGKVSAGQSAVQVDGVVTNAVVTRQANQMIINAGSLNATLSGVDNSGNRLPLDSEGNLHLDVGDVINVSVGGFKPGSIVEVWLFSTPKKLGSIVVAADGKVDGKFSIPTGVKSGSHRVVITARLANGKPTTFTLGILVGNISKTSTLTRVLIAIPITLAIGFGFLLPTQMRHRRRRRLTAN